MSAKLYFGASAALRLVLQLVEDFGATRLPLVLLGPTGCGKTVLAREIHERSRRRGELVECSLAEIPDELRHSTLAGHVRGAYTGAVESRPGLIEAAHGGTLFLDELHLATPPVQHCLLQGLERPYTVRVRDTQRRFVDVRFLFATNREPIELLRQGVWSEDFYYRLGFNHIKLPGLRDLPDDILPLAERFLGHYLEVVGKPWAPTFAAEVEDTFERYPWPGNIRELEMVCQYAAARLAAPGPVTLAELPPQHAAFGTPRERTPGPDPRQEQVDAALRDAQGNKSEAARRLQISRQSLHRILRRPGTVR